MSSKPGNWQKSGLEPKGHPTLLDIAWAAGIYEGEGCCHNGYKNHYYGVSISQKDWWLLEKLQSLFGGSISLDKRNGAGHWRLSGPRGRGFAMTIYKWLSPIRKQQIQRLWTR